MNGKSVAPDGKKMAAGATETERIRKNVAPDGTKMAAGQRKIGEVGKAWSKMLKKVRIVQKPIPS